MQGLDSTDWNLNVPVYYFVICYLDSRTSDDMT